ncbi:hypothetical protein ABER23_15850 [Paenibacillus lautus]|uniref:hypothetical protein n=1 Tax=Paenibacillus lautus TaxID=1401 RepID=UPI003D2809DF
MEIRVPPSDVGSGGASFLWLDTFRMPNLSMSMYFYYGMNRADAEEVLGTGQEHFS